MTPLIPGHKYRLDDGTITHSSHQSPQSLSERKAP